MDRNTVMPKWQRELISFKGIKSTFIIEGNISDEYPFFMQEDANFFSLNKVINVSSTKRIKQV
jgi:hypothetical protein